MQRYLRDLKPGEKGAVLKLDCEGAVKRRMMDMGVTRGSKLLVRKVVPLGGPIEVNIRGYELSFRKEEAAKIMIK